jgi:hypothetical protein
VDNNKPTPRPVGHDEAVAYFQAEVKEQGSVTVAAEVFSISPFLGRYIVNGVQETPIGSLAIRKILTVKANRGKMGKYERDQAIIRDLQYKGRRDR